MQLIPGLSMERFWPCHCGFYWVTMVAEFER